MKLKVSEVIRTNVWLNIEKCLKKYVKLFEQKISESTCEQFVMFRKSLFEILKKVSEPIRKSMWLNIEKCLNKYLKVSK